LKKRVFELEEENAQLMEEMTKSKKEYDVFAARVLSISKENERLQIERDLLLKSSMDGSPVGPTHVRNNSFPGRAQASRHQHDIPVKTVCVVSSLDLIEGKLTSSTVTEPFLKCQPDGTVLLGGNHRFTFDSCLALMAPASYDRIMLLIGNDIFDSLIEGESRTILVLGDLHCGKAALLEGISYPYPSGSPDTVAHDDANVSNLSNLSSPRQSRKNGLLEVVAGRLFTTLAALMAESAAMGNRTEAAFSIHLSGFQTFRDGRVVDFLVNLPSDEDECQKVLIESSNEFERLYSKMLKKKVPMVGSGDGRKKGIVTDPNTCVVITFELTKPSDPSFKSKLRVIETCAIDEDAYRDPLVGHIVEGIVSTLVLVHPLEVHSKTTIASCTNGLEVAKRFA